MDGRVHFINIDRSRSNFRFYRSNSLVSRGQGYTIQNGDTLANLANQFGISLPQLLAANEGITDQDVISSGSTLNIPALAYTVQNGDTVQSIADSLGSTMGQIAALNSEISDMGSIEAGRIIRVPTTVDNLPLAYTVQDGDSLPLLSGYLGLDQTSLDELNPGMMSLESLETGSIIALPNFLTSTGDITFTDTLGSEPFQKRDFVAKLTSAIKSRRQHPRGFARRALAV